MLGNWLWSCGAFGAVFLMYYASWKGLSWGYAEAAFIDGCGRVGSFFRLILPLSRPIILSVALIMFLSTWSQFQIPLILASSMETKPMAIVISEFVTKDSVQYGLVAAAGMLALVPPALAAFIFRKYLVTGMTNGSVKG